jgi:transketolase
MRTAFIETLCELAQTDERIWLLTGDLGFSVLERFGNYFPERFVNMGVAEQNMTSVAAGLALTGKTVFTYSIANFPVIRCLEQIRNDVCYHNLNVKIVAVGSGVSYGTAGYSHHGIEDIALMQSMPNMTVITPADPFETKQVMHAIISKNGPCYLRLGRGGEPNIYGNLSPFEIGKATCLNEGTEIAIFSTGPIISEVLKALVYLKKNNVNPYVINFPTLKPFDDETVKQIASKVKNIFTVDEHTSYGGFTGSVSKAMAMSGFNCKLTQICLTDEYISITGTQSYLHKYHGIDAEFICKKILEVLK